MVELPFDEDREERTAQVLEHRRAILDPHFFVRILSPSAFHWHFDQSFKAIDRGLYLPGVSGLINGIEASLRTISREINGQDIDGDDLGKTLSNGLLLDAANIGLDVKKLAFPHEMTFIEDLNAKKPYVRLVKLRHAICHGNLNEFVQNSSEFGQFFTPECLRPISAQLLEMSFDWAYEVSRFREEQEWMPPKEPIERPRNPLSQYLPKD